MVARAMKGWVELKEAFWAALEGGPPERSRRIEALASIDPSLPGRLEAMLAADAEGDALLPIFDSAAHVPEHPARIGPYDVIGLIGAGGMGEVYRARDARLGRDIAIKVLPKALANDADRLTRFEREARVLASLNHPHVAQVYGLEDAAGAPALVMELVEGRTLAQLIEGYPGARPSLARVLRIAWQITDGLAAAHEKGIVHRDLKPGNIAVTEDGDVKILDFGIAKSLAGGVSNGVDSGDATAAGVLLGTPAYMSPEQARGLPLDRRADIWAFGCVLFELLTGQGPFAATTPSDSLVAVLEREPDLSLLPPETPTTVRSLLRHCLEKEPGRRLRDIADARLAIEDAREAPMDPWRWIATGEGGSRRSVRRAAVLWSLVGLVGLAAAGAGVNWLLRAADPPPETRRMVASLVLPRGLRLAGSDLPARFSESRFAISPDGRRFALIATDSTNQSRIWVRELDSAVFQPLAETEDAAFPFWSPNSESIGFMAAGGLKTVKVYGGKPVTVTEAGFQTGSWSREDLILFAPAGRSPIFVVPAAGGAPRQVTTLDSVIGEVRHAYPSFLPDGRHFLYFAYGSVSGGALDPRGVFLGSLDDSTRATPLLTGVTQAKYANGHLLFVKSGTLMAQPFDTLQLELRGAPFPLVENANLDTGGATGATAGYSVSDNGILAYQVSLGTESRPVWFDRAGRDVAAFDVSADFGEVALSPDGERIAVSVLDPARATRDLWLYDSDGSNGQRLTAEPGDEFAPVWSPDGAGLLFSAARSGLVDLYVSDLSLVVDPSPLQVDTFGQGRFATDWSRNREFFVYVGGGRAIATSDLWVAPVARPEQARPILNSPFVETHGRVAPAGDLLAYSSNETGRMEVYVDRFPDLGTKRIVSVGGGGWPLWSADGDELFYLSPNNELMAVGVRTTRERWEISAPRRLFNVDPRPPVRLDAYPYDVSRDGRFLVNTILEEPTSTVITLVVNWTAGAARQ